MTDKKPPRKKLGRPPQPLTPRKPDVAFTPERKEKFLDYVREHGTLYRAAQSVGIDYRTVTNHRAKDPEFAHLMDMAKQQHVDMLVEEATRRAVKGVPKPLLGGQFKDEVVAYEQVYSDGLMQTLLKANREEYGSGGAGGGGGGPGGGRGGGGVLIVCAAPHTISEWTRLYGEKAKGMTGKPANE